MDHPAKYVSGVDAASVQATSEGEGVSLRSMQRDQNGLVKERITVDPKALSTTYEVRRRPQWPRLWRSRLSP